MSCSREQDTAVLKYDDVLALVAEAAATPGE